MCSPGFKSQNLWYLLSDEKEVAHQMSNITSVRKVCKESYGRHLTSTSWPSDIVPVDHAIRKPRGRTVPQLDQNLRPSWHASISYS